MKPAHAWAMYDWANSAFATTIIAGFFPVFFKQYWSAGTDPTVSTFQLGVANSVGSVIVALCAPILGAIADSGSTKKRLLLAFAGMGIVMTGALFFVAQGHWGLAVALYVFASVGFASSNIFYDALLVSVADEEGVDRVSARGFALGYLGGLLFALNVTMTLTPQTFGLPDASAAVRVSFLSVALWWAVFSIPLALWVHEPSSGRQQRGWTAITAAFRQLLTTLRHVHQLRVVVVFLVAYWLYIDAVYTIIRMAVDYGMALGFAPTSLIVALLITQFVGFPAALAFGTIGTRWGAKQGILLGLAIYSGIIVWAFFMRQVWEFYALAIAVGLVQGGVQSLSRSLYSRLIPTQQAAEFFGFYNMWGKYADIIGPVLMGWVGLLTGNPRSGVLVIVTLLLGGAALLTRVRESAV